MWLNLLNIACPSFYLLLLFCLSATLNILALYFYYSISAKISLLLIMDPQEEQQQEIEVLQSIYPDELDLISPTHFTIKLALDTPSDRKHSLLLDVRYPPAYPEEVPNLDLIASAEELEELDSDDEDDSQKLLHLAELIEFEKADLSILHDKLDEEAEMNIGIPSVFALAALLKDEAEMLFVHKLDVAQKKYDKNLLAQEAEEQKKFRGTKVTKESFAQWRESFRKEMNFELEDKRRFEAMHNGKMTGREIFEKGLAGEIDEDYDLVESVAKVAVN